MQRYKSKVVHSTAGERLFSALKLATLEQEGRSRTTEGGTCTTEGGTCITEGGTCTTEGGTCTQRAGLAQQRAGLAQQRAGEWEMSGGEDDNVVVCSITDVPSYSTVIALQ